MNSTDLVIDPGEVTSRAIRMGLARHFGKRSNSQRLVDLLGMDRGRAARLYYRRSAWKQPEVDALLRVIPMDLSALEDEARAELIESDHRGLLAHDQRIDDSRELGMTIARTIWAQADDPEFLETALRALIHETDSCDRMLALQQALWNLGVIIAARVPFRDAAPFKSHGLEQFGWA